MSNEIQFIKQLVFNKVADDKNHYAFFDIDTNTEQLIIKGVNQSGSTTTRGGLVVEGGQVRFKGVAEFDDRVDVVGDVSAPTVNIDILNARSGNEVRVNGDLRISGNLITEGDNNTPGQVLIGDPIQTLNTEDPGVPGGGVSTNYAGILVKRGYPTNETTPGGNPGQGERPSAPWVWDEAQYAWNLNYQLALETGDPRIIRLGTPTVDQENAAANVKFVKDHVTDAVTTRIGLDTLTDVTVVGDLATNRVLTYAPGTSDWRPSGFTLTNLDDTTAVSVAGGYLRWNGTGTTIAYETTIPIGVVSGRSTVSESGQATLSNLEDTAIGSIATGHTLRWDGTTWRNTALDFGDITNPPDSSTYTLTGLSDTTAVSLANGYLRWNGTGTSVVYETTIPSSSVSGLSTVSQSGQATIANLEDTAIVSPLDNQTLSYFGGTWINKAPDYNDLVNAPTNASYTLTGLSDVADTSVANGYLRWDGSGTTVTFEQTISSSSITGLSPVALSGQGSLDYLTDVSVATPSTGQVLRYNGSGWANTQLDYADLANAPGAASTLTGLTDTTAVSVAGGYLRWDGTGTSVVYETTIPLADTANRLATARSISLSGDATGTASFDGSANVTISTTVADNSHAHTIANVTGLQAALDGKLATTAKAADSELLDGIDSTGFLRSNTSDQFTAGTLTFNDNVRIGFGTSNGESTLFSNGVDTFWDFTAVAGNDLFMRYGTSNRFTFDMANGNLTSTGNVGITSDAKFKTNLEKINDALSKVCSLTGYTYDRTDIDLPRQVGLLAQDIEKVLPEAVGEMNTGELTVYYGNLAGLFVEAFKETHDENIQLKSEIKGMREEIDKLKSAVEKLLDKSND